MYTIQELSNYFDNNKDISNFTEYFSENNIGLRFLLIRSLDKPHLKDLLDEQNIQSPSDKIKDLLISVFHSPIDIDHIVKYIENKRSEILKQRTEAEKEHLDIINNFGPVNCGLRNDKVDDIVKTLVRDKNINSINVLEERIEYSIVPRIKNYILWSFYNQTTNDLIEHTFIRNNKIIPTLRKIPNIDFFIKVNEQIIPFDLKITHISEDFFDLHTQGIIPSPENSNDSFLIRNEGVSEIKKIKEFYKANKKRLNLPNYGSFSKNELLEILYCSNDFDAQKFVNEAYTHREESINEISKELKKLEWWNYKYQGERLFSNNNRLFIFLAYTNVFEDGRPLKGKLEIIEKEIDSLLSSIDSTSLNNINYLYEKDPSLNGSYSAQSLSILITDKK